MTTAHEVKFELERQLLAFAEDGCPPYVGVHSVVVEDGVASFGFDVQREGSQEATVMFFHVDLPIEQVSLRDMREFAAWLAQPSWAGRTLQ
jgi:hypothetical protein